MREFRTLGSARGAARKGGPYRDWRVQQVPDVPPSGTYQHLLDAVGSKEVQATAHMETIQGLVAWAHQKRARTLRSLGMDARVPMDWMRRAE